MKNLFTCLATYLLMVSSLGSQVSSLAPSLAEGDTYALIIGISSYQDSAIRDLKYAHKDAEAFAEYLNSPAGGNVPKDNISFLSDDQATISNIYVAKRNLEQQAKKGDLIYFYFSGHGAVESGLYNLGFFLAHDTPHKNYLTNAVRIEDINMMANTLSVTKDVQVILITDACHSGRLTTGDNRSNMLIGEQLIKSQKNEIRMASCEPDQLSQEGDAWGGGRGVFSYYLINGMKGLADTNDKDGVVSLGELRMYLEKKVPKDVMQLKASDQVPVISGKSLKMVALVDEDALNSIHLDINLDSASTLIGKSVDYDPSPVDRYFKALSGSELLEEVDWTKWKRNKPKKIIKQALELFADCEVDSISSSSWRKSLDKDKTKREAYGQRLAAAIHNHIQPVVNDYMDGPREFRGKRAINKATAELEQYADMLEVAYKLLQDDNYLYKIIGVKKHYMRVMSLYIQIPYVKDPEQMAEQAKAEQEKALSYEEKAGYLQFSMQFSSSATRNTDGKIEKSTQIKKE